MRTRRIAIRCRRTGRSAAVAIGSTGTGLPADPPVPEMPPGFGVSPGHESLPMLDLPPLYGAPVAGAPVGDPTAGPMPAVDLSVPAYIADVGPADAGGPADAKGHGPAGPAGPRPAAPSGVDGAGGPNPWRSNRGPDLTLADILARPGRRDQDWNRNPGWPAGVGWAHIAHAARGPSPRHARAGRRWIRWRTRRPAVAWTGVAVLATAAIMLAAEVLR